MIPVIGVDPGWRWTGLVLRHGDQAVNGGTVGPTDAAGNVNPTAIDRAEPAALQRLVERVGATVDLLWDQAEPLDNGRVAVAIETPTMPRGYSTLPARAFLVTHTVAYAVAARFPGSRLVTPDRPGRRHLDQGLTAYPTELRRKRPPYWQPCDAPRNARDHERAAFDATRPVAASLVTEVAA